MADIELLLTHADDDQPVLQSGMAWEAAANGSSPDNRKDGERLHASDIDHRADGADPNDIQLQRWGVVVPDDAAVGKRLLGLIDPLFQARKQQQGVEPKVYKVPRGMGPEESSRWWNDVYQDEETDETDRPRYLLILGDADLISWDFQQRLALDIFIGRLAFPSDDGYAAYATKVLAHEARRPADGARALFYAVRDGTAATTAGYNGLMLPTVTAAREGMKKGTFDAKEIVVLGEESGDDALDPFYDAVGADTPTLMFSISHGLGAPRRGWGSLDEQRRFQGAMSFGGGQRLTHEDVATRPFLPGGAWFYFASLGAGTPDASAYKTWLAELEGAGLFGGSLDDVLRSIPPERSGQPPFVSRLPQAALANENGPLAVLGHVDLAWTFGFQEYVVRGGQRIAKNRPSRFQDIFRELVEGKRMGAGYTALQRFFNSASGDLSAIYDQEARATAKKGPLDADPIKKMRKATLWLERQDLSSYVLLGDPAVRLNVNATRAQRSASAPVTMGGAAPAAPDPAPESRVKTLESVEEMERAVLPILNEDSTAKKVAAQLGVDREDVAAWVDAYQAAGRAALAKL